MRNLCVLLISLASLSSGANLGELLAAVSNNDIARAQEILLEDSRARRAFIETQAELEPKDRKRPPPLLVNREDQHGIRPLFLAWTPEMAQLLFDFGAHLREFEDWRILPLTLHVDRFGRTPLHYLLSVTVPTLMRETPPAQREDLLRRIEATALLLMRVNVQDYMRDQLPIEFHQDNGDDIAYAHAGNWAWTPAFLNRLGREYFLQLRAQRREEELQRRAIQQDAQRRVNEERQRGVQAFPEPEARDVPVLQIVRPVPVRAEVQVDAPIARPRSVDLESLLNSVGH